MTTTISIVVEGFAAAGDALPGRSVVLEVPPSATVDDAWRVLCERHRALAALGATLAFARNQRLVSRSETLVDGDVLALLPPVSGG